MTFCGRSNRAVARCIGIDPRTLRKHFADDLLNGYAQRRRDIVRALFDRAMSGNVWALCRLEAMMRASIL